jgi:hypothetical protein
LCIGISFSVKADNIVTATLQPHNHQYQRIMFTNNAPYPVVIYSFVVQNCTNIGVPTLPNTTNGCGEMLGPGKVTVNLVIPGVGSDGQRHAFDFDVYPFDTGKAFNFVGFTFRYRQATPNDLGNGASGAN